MSEYPHGKLDKSGIAADDVDLLNELADGEDEFDVDLMACGCRLASDLVQSVPALSAWGMTALGMAIAGTTTWLLKRRQDATIFDVKEVIRTHDLDTEHLTRLVAAVVDETDLSREDLDRILHDTIPVADGNVQSHDLPVERLVQNHGMGKPELTDLLHHIIIETKLSGERFGELVSDVCGDRDQRPV